MYTESPESVVGWNRIPLLDLIVGVDKVVWIRNPLPTAGKHKSDGTNNLTALRGVIGFASEAFREREIDQRRKYRVLGLPECLGSTTDQPVGCLTAKMRFSRQQPVDSRGLLRRLPVKGPGAEAIRAKASQRSAAANCPAIRLSDNFSIQEMFPCPFELCVASRSALGTDWSATRGSAKTCTGTIIQ